MQAYIINLKRCVDRKTHMQQEINRVFEQDKSLEQLLQFEFFEAIDGASNVNGGGYFRI